MGYHKLRLEELASVPQVNRELVYQHLCRLYDSAAADERAARKCYAPTPWMSALVAQSLSRTMRAVDLLGQLCLDPLDTEEPLPPTMAASGESQATKLTNMRAMIQRYRDRADLLEAQLTREYDQLYREKFSDKESE